MVLQRDRPIPIWGKSTPGSIVSIRLGSINKTTKTLKDSTWQVSLPKRHASNQPLSIYISNRDTTIQIQNIFIGDIWVCVGQSNMEWPMIKEMHYENEVAGSIQPMLRFYNPSYAGKNTYSSLFTDSIINNLTSDKFYLGQWQESDSISFKTMSAVAYYFGKEIISSEKIPIGLVNLSIGGAPLETFIDMEVLKSNRVFTAKVNGDWLNNNALPVWIRERGNQNVGSLNKVPKDKYGSNHAFKPGFAYKAGIQPILKLSIKGVLCYQGESNAQEIERVMEYPSLSKLMIDDYRKKWKNSDMPFYFVQLSSIDTIKYRGHLWPDFRNEQRKMLAEISNTGMAVSSDIGTRDDVHPRNKKLVGGRLARWALNKTYNRKMTPSGPLPLSAKYKNGKVVITFEYIANELKTSDGNKLKGFSFDGKNERPSLLLDRNVIMIAKEKPEYVYYGWNSYSIGNLINSENLPASTFKIRVQ